MLAADRNGPRGWTTGTITLLVGPVVSFDGLEARWMGQGLLPRGTTLTYATLSSLAQKRRLPPGWRFGVQVLDRDLTISTPQGQNRILQDELRNTFDACTQGACNVQP